MLFRSIIRVGPRPQKLSIVKTIKEATGYGLKHSKDIVDALFADPLLETELYSQISLKELEAKLTDTGCEWSIGNRERERNLKMIELGLGDRADLISEVSHQIGSQLYTRLRPVTDTGWSREEKNSELKIKCDDFILDLFSGLSETSLTEIFNSLKKEKI